MIRDEETIQALVATVERFVNERLRPLEAQVSETDQIPPDVVQDMRAMGLFGLTIPEEFGGLGLTMEEEVRVMMALGRTSPAFRSVIGTTVGIGSQGIVFDGTPAQKAQWLPKLATGELIAWARSGPFLVGALCGLLRRFGAARRVPARQPANLLLGPKDWIKRPFANFPTPAQRLSGIEAGASPVRLEQRWPEAARHIPRPCHPDQGCVAQTSARRDRGMRDRCGPATC
jgi:hypothetical protein